MYQKIIVPIDHGNRNMKTEHKVFTERPLSPQQSWGE